MDDDFTRAEEETYTPRRSFSLSVEGDCADEIEMAALDAACEFFGPRVQLRIMPDYAGHPASATSDKKFGASITVVTVEPA